MPATAPYARNQYRSQDFTYDAATKTFYAEASTLQWHAGDVYVTSARTGNTVTFLPAHTERDGEGDATAWVFRGTGAATGCTLKIFND